MSVRSRIIFWGLVSVLLYSGVVLFLYGDDTQTQTQMNQRMNPIVEQDQRSTATGVLAPWQFYNPYGPGSDQVLQSQSLSPQDLSVPYSLGGKNLLNDIGIYSAGGLLLIDRAVKLPSVLVSSAVITTATVNTSLIVPGLVRQACGDSSHAVQYFSSGTFGCQNITSNSLLSTTNTWSGGNTFTSSTTFAGVTTFGISGSSVVISSNTVMPGATFYQGASPQIGSATLPLIVSSITANGNNLIGPTGFFSGSIIQFVSTTNTVSFSTVSTTYVQTKLVGSISPRIQTSTICIFAWGVGFTVAGGAGSGSQYTLFRNSTNLAGSNALWRLTSTGANENDEGISLGWCDSPGTTTQTFYSVRMKCESAGAGISCGGFADGVETNYMTMIEIAP